MIDRMGNWYPDWPGQQPYQDPAYVRAYGVELADYRLTLMIFLLASGTVAMLNLFVALLTAMRKQKHLLLAYAAASLLLLLAGRPVFSAYGLNPMCWFYLAVLLLVLGWCVGVYCLTVKKEGGTGTT